MSPLPNHTCSGCEPAVYVSHNPDALSGWLAPLMVTVKTSKHSCPLVSIRGWTRTSPLALPIRAASSRFVVPSAKISH